MRDELRAVLRTLRTDWRFTIATASLLAITLGAVSSMFAAVEAVLLRPLGFADQDRLAVVWQRDLRRELPVIEVAYGEAVDWRARSRTFQAFAVFGSVNWALSLAGPEQSVPLSMSAVSGSFFRVLGVRPALGRTLSSEDEKGGVPGAAVLSYGTWIRRFGGDPAIIGRTLEAVDAGKPSILIPIVGVMPKTFDFPRHTDVWIPAAPLIRQAASAFTNGNEHAAMQYLRVFYAIGRLHDGVDVGAAERELTDVIRTTDTRGGPEPPTDAVVTRMTDFLIGPAGPVLWTLLGGTALLLLIACANVAGLQVSRAVRRQRELAVRMALGASRARLVRQTMLDTAGVGAVSIGGALLVAFALQRALVALAPADVFRLGDIDVFDARVLIFGTVTVFGAIILCGVWPVVALGRLDATHGIAHGSLGAADPGGRRLQRVVVTLQVALAVVLLVGAAVFLRSIRALDHTVLGFDPERLVAVNVSSSVADIARWNMLSDQIEQQIAAVPDIEAVGAVYRRPLLGPIGLDNQPLYPGQDPQDPSTWGLNPHLNVQAVTPGYFRSTGVRLVRGRGFTAADTVEAPGVVIVSERAARRLWPGQHPIGQRLRDMSYRSADPAAWQTVVGIAEDVHYRGLTDVRLDLYVPAAQSTERVQYVMVRTDRAAGEVARLVQRAAHAIDRRIEVGEAAAMRDVVAQESAPWRFVFRIFSGFAVLAFALSAAGLATIITLAVATRRRELGIRAALGAGRRQLSALVLREGLRLIIFGAVFGLVGSLVLGRAVATVLIGVSPHDPVSLAAAIAIATAVGVLACWWSARRAGHVGPEVALRSD